MSSGDSRASDPRADDPRTGDSAGVIRVAPLPARHPYLSRILRLARPWIREARAPGVSGVPGTPGGNGEAPARFDFDILHVAAGPVAGRPADVEAFCDSLARRGKRLVCTVPNLPASDTPRDLDVLRTWIERADCVITHTPFARRRIERRYQRTALVLPCLHVVSLAELKDRQSRFRRRHHGFLLGLRFDDPAYGLAADLPEARQDREDPEHRYRLRFLRETLAAIHGLDGVRLRLHLSRWMTDPGSPGQDPSLPRLVRRHLSEEAGRLKIELHRDGSAEDRWDWLESVDALLLPCADATHSELLEACRDLGTAVIAQDRAGFADQGAEHIFRLAGPRAPDPFSLAEAIRSAVRAGRPRPFPVADRERQRHAVAAAHRSIYARLMVRSRREVSTSPSGRSTRPRTGRPGGARPGVARPGR